MLRIASAWRSDSENSAISTGLGSSSVPDDLDHAIEIEIGDEKAVEQFNPIIDLADADLAAADEHLDLEGEPGGQRLLQAHHTRRTARVEDVEVQREADFEVGQPVKALEQQIGIHGPRTRLENQPDLLVALVLHVGKDRQLLVGDQLRDLLDQLRLLERRMGFR